jgi:hypothetical protein
MADKELDSHSQDVAERDTMEFASGLSCIMADKDLDSHSQDVAERKNLNFDLSDFDGSEKNLPGCAVD